MHFLLHGGHKSIDVIFAALGLELHTAIGDVAYEPCNLELFSHLQNGVAEAHTLDVAGEKDGFVAYLGHASPEAGPWDGRVQSFKCLTYLLSHGEDRGKPRFKLLFRRPGACFRAYRMSNFDSDGSPDGEWDERGELAWNEFDWERYLREQDEAVSRYLGFYEAHKDAPDRIDLVAQKMGWGHEEWTDDSSDSSKDSDDEDDDDFSDETEVYTLHKNPIFIATKAIYLGLQRSWEAVAISNKVPQPLAVTLTASLHRGEEQAVQAIHALDFGDYAMAVSLFKRALSALNGSLALLNSDSVSRVKPVQTWREEMLPRFFDLREVWLRVMAECREELDRPIDDDN